jgi:hypothetical protein
MHDVLIAGGRVYLPGGDPHDPPVCDILVKDGRIATAILSASRLP